MSLVPQAAVKPLARAIPASATSLADSRAGALALGALNGAIGDGLARLESDLALELTIRRHGRAVPTDSAGVAQAFPGATPRLAVFLHGLGETESSWRIGSERPYGSRLRDELGYTPVYVRYNSGLHVSDNGRRLSEVLQNLVKAWPTEVEEIAFVGHSMGGLIARSACHYGKAGDAQWAPRVKHVFCLATPHLGAPLEKAASLASWTLGRLPETRPFAALMDVRSEGIKDLGHGSCAEEDWCDCDPAAFPSDRCTDVPFLETANYYFVGATLSRRQNGALGSICGDLLVRFPSASGSGRRRRIPFEIDNGCHVGGITHFHLLNHPAVYARLREWLGRAPAVLAA
jgi:pimeloyl-ACP methyl ester carboxylesterase